MGSTPSKVRGSFSSKLATYTRNFLNRRFSNKPIKPRTKVFCQNSRSYETAFPTATEYQKRERTAECFGHHSLTWSLALRANQGPLFEQEKQTSGQAGPRRQLACCTIGMDNLLQGMAGGRASTHSCQLQEGSASSFHVAWRKARPRFGIYQTRHQSERCWALLQPRQGTSECCEGQNFNHEIGQGTT